jgi:uncharacterized protein with HEPN domain
LKREVGDYIQDIVDAMEKSIKFVGDMTYDEFAQDDKTAFAVIRALEVIGEAVKKIPNELKERYPDVPWRDMSGMRDKLIHKYHGVKLDVVWIAVKEEILPLKSLFEKILRELKSES